MHVQFEGPTVAACSVPAGRSRRSPAVSSRSPSAVWNTIEPSRQNSTLCASWRWRPYRSPGPLDQVRGASHPSSANAASAPSRSLEPEVLVAPSQAGREAAAVRGRARGERLATGVKPLDEASVRCALAWAVDRESIAKVVYFGRAKPARSPLPSSTLFYDPNADAVGYDLDKAKALLAKSSVPSGFTFETQVSSGDTAAAQVAQIWAASLAKIGVNMTIKSVEATTAQDLYNTEKYAMEISGWTNDTPDPDEFMGVALDYQPQNGLHSSYHSDAARNEVLAARKETDPAKRQKLYSDLQRIVSTECPFIYLDEQDRLYAASPAVHDFAPNAQGKYGLENVWKQ